MPNDQNKGTSWTDDEVAELRRLAKENIPTPLISNKLGRTWSAIESKAQAENTSLKPTNRPYD